MSSRIAHILITPAILLCMGGTAVASLVTYEPFDYAADTTLGGQNGGIGWNAPWAAGAAQSLATNVAGSLAYTDPFGNSLLSSGGSVIVGHPAGNSATTAQPNRALINNLSGGTGTTAGVGGTSWISFLYKRLSPNPGTLPFLRQATLGYFEGTGERVLVGGPNSSATVSNVLSVWGTSGTHLGGSPFQAGAYSVTNSSTYFILIKNVTDGTAAADTAYVWFNWTNLTVEPDVSTATIVQNEMNISSVNTFRFQAGNLNANGSNALFQVDEFRLGTTFTDVTPSFTGSVLPPTISDQPDDTSVTATDTAQFSLTAGGNLPLHYQWYFNTNTPVGTDTNVLIIPNVQAFDAGYYQCIITNEGGSITSSIAKLTVLDPELPTISVQPQNWTNAIGFPATFSVSATGSAPLMYQWYFNTNTPLLNQTTTNLSFVITSTSNAGAYTVIVTNKFGSTTSEVATLTISAFSVAQLPAFPGADGAAKFVTGGRGGTVYHVTKLDKNFNDASPGTLRYGLGLSGTKTIVFDVAGVFWLGRYGAESNYDNGWNAGQSRYNLSGNTTIAGQTAPGPVIIMGGVTKAGSANTIIRNVMFAPGYGMQGFHEPPTPPTPGDFPDSYVYDALDISGNNIMMDHLTTMYITDEAISCNELAYSLTVQNCNISQGQNYPQADAESTGVSYTGHALAHLLQAGSNARISILNNLYAHNKGRLPRVGSEIGTGAFNDFRNNVFYNWLGTAGSGAGGQPSFNNFINNFYLAGPGGENPVGGSNSNIVNSSGGTGIFSGSDSTLTRVFHSGNVKDVNKDSDPDDSSALSNGDFGSSAFQVAAYNLNIGLTLSAKDAFTNVLRHVGSRWWERPYDFRLGNTSDITTNDINAYVNERLIKETVTGTGKIIAWADDPFNSDPNEGVEWRSLLALRADPISGVAPFNRSAGWDTDNDGMPDSWETKHSLDPNVANNNGDFDNDFYTDLEEYLNELAAYPAPGPILFTGSASSRYAQIFNWQVNGQVVNISGLGNATTFSFWQPSRFDTAVISNTTIIVDAVGQHAGMLQLTNNATLEITNGWLEASSLHIGTGCTFAVKPAGTLRLTGSGSITLAPGATFTNLGILDIMTWSGTLPDGFVNNGTVIDSSAIQLTSPMMDANDFKVTVYGYAGHEYQLEYRDNLSSGDWQNAGVPVAGENAPILLVHTSGVSADQRLYRVAVDP